MRGELNTALVTGASSGIGAATVQALATAGMAVHALGRRAERLERLAAQTGCTPVVADVRDGAALQAALAGLAPDVVVNGAGVGFGMGGLAAAGRADIERTIGTNLTALLDVLRLVLPGMIDRGRGHVVNIGSVAGLLPVHSAIYGASKGAVHKLCQDLRLELRGTGIRVSEICPGRVDTEFAAVAFPEQAAAGFPGRERIRELRAEDVAAAVLHAVAAPPHVNVSMIELNPVEQVLGGQSFTPVEWPA